MSELLKLYRDAQRRYEKFVRYYATAPVGALIYYDMLLDRYSEADQIFVKRVLELEAESTTLTARIAELEKDNDEFRQLTHDRIIILTPDDGYVPDSECNDVATPIDVALRKRIAELETERRWIPVSERMPDDWESVLTIDISKSTRDMVTAFYNPETSLWSTHFSCDLWVTHWIPLPEPPIVYGKESEE